MANPEVVLQLKNATLSVQSRVLFSNLSMQIHSGEIVLVIGRSGVGKSSLMNVINGVYPNGDTDVQCEGLEILGHSLLTLNHLERTKYVRSIFQNARLSFQWGNKNFLIRKSFLHTVSPLQTRVLHVEK